MIEGVQNQTKLASGWFEHNILRVIHTFQKLEDIYAAKSAILFSTVKVHVLATETLCTNWESKQITW